MALSQRCFSAQPPFPSRNTCTGRPRGETPHQHPPGQHPARQEQPWIVSAPGCFDPERSAPLGWDRGQTRGTDGESGGEPSPPRSIAARCFAGSRTSHGASHPTSEHTSRSSPWTGFHPRAPKTESGFSAPSRLLPASSSPRAQLHPAGLQPNHSCTQERGRQGEAAPSTGHTCPGQRSLPRHTLHGED